jgi:hypothetical protein
MQGGGQFLHAFENKQTRRKTTATTTKNNYL